MMRFTRYLFIVEQTLGYLSPLPFEARIDKESVTI
jgi:hypothetical protein